MSQPKVARTRKPQHHYHRRDLSDLRDPILSYHPNAVLRQVIGGVSGLDDPKSVLGWADAIVFYSRALWFSNPAVTVLATIGVGVALAEKRGTIAIGVVGTYLFLVSVLYFTVTLEARRYIIIAMPFLTLSAGYGLARIHERLSDKRIALTAAMVPGGSRLRVQHSHFRQRDMDANPRRYPFSCA